MALAAIAGLLGAVAGSGLALRRGERRGGWKIAIQRRDERHERDYGAGARPGMGTAYGGSIESRKSRVVTPGEAARPDAGSPTDPYHH